MNKALSKFEDFSIKEKKKHSRNVCSLLASCSVLGGGSGAAEGTGDGGGKSTRGSKNLSTFRPISDLPPNMLNGRGNVGQIMKMTINPPCFPL